MADVGTLLMKVDADTKKFEKGIMRSQKAFKGMTKAIKVGAVVAGAAIVGIGAKSIKVAQEQERAEARLESIAKKVTKATDAQVQSMKKLAAQYQKVTTFGDEVIISGQSQILSFGTTTKQAEALTGSLTDLLAATKGVNATQEDAINAANMLGKAINGQAGALTRAGIIMNEQQKELIETGTQAERVAAIVDIMNDNYGGLAETMAKTSEGQMKQFKNALGDVGEQIGNMLLPILNKLVSFLADSLPTIQEVGTRVFNTIITVGTKLYNVFKDNVLPIIQVLVSWVVSNMPTFQAIFEKVFAKTKEVLMIVWDFIQNNIIPILVKLFNWVKENLPQIKETALNVFEGVISILTATWTFIKDYIIPIIQTMYEFFKELIPKILEIVKPVFENIVSLATTLWNFFKDNIIPVIQAVYDIVLSLIPKLAPIFETAFAAIGSVINGIILTIDSFVKAIQKAIEITEKFFKVSTKASDISGGGFSGTGGISQGLTPFIQGQRANGGPVTGGSSYLVGEKGPEIFTPSTSGMVSAGGSNITININGTTDPNLIMNKVVQVLHQQGIARR